MVGARGCSLKETCRCGSCKRKPKFFPEHHPCNIPRPGAPAMVEGIMPKPAANHRRSEIPDVEVEQPEHFGPRVRKIREERGLSLRKVATAAGIPPSVLSKF